MAELDNEQSSGQDMDAFFSENFDKFIGNSNEEEAVADLAQDTATDNTEGETEQEKEGEEKTTEDRASLEAPDNWSKEMKESFAELTDRAKQVMLEQYKYMQADYTKKTTERAEDTKFTKSIKELFAPHREYLNQYGLSEQQAIKRLIDLDVFARQNPAGYITHAAKMLGVDLENLVFGADEQPKQQPVDSHTLQKLSMLEQKLNRYEQERAYKEQATVESEIDSFRNAKDESGELKYPLFDDFSLKIGRLLETGEANTLEDAYNLATKNVSSFMSTAVQKRLEAEQKRLGVQKAKQAGRGVSTPSFAKPSQSAPTNLDDVIAHAMRETGFKAS